MDRRTIACHPEAVLASLRARRMDDDTFRCAVDALHLRGQAAAELEQAHRARRSASTANTSRRARERVRDAQAEFQRRDKALRGHLLALPNVLHALDPSLWDSHLRRCPFPGEDAVAEHGGNGGAARVAAVASLVVDEAARRGYQAVEPGGLVQPLPRASDGAAVARILTQLPGDHLPGSRVGGVFADLREETWPGAALRRLTLRHGEDGRDVPASDLRRRGEDLRVGLLSVVPSDVEERELQSVVDLLLALLAAFGLQTELVQLPPWRMPAEDGVRLALLDGSRPGAPLAEAALQGAYLARREGLRGDPHTVTASLDVSAVADSLSPTRAPPPAAAPPQRRAPAPRVRSGPVVVTEVAEDRWASLWQRSRSRTVFSSTGWAVASSGALHRWAVEDGGEYVAGVVLPASRIGVQQGTITAYLGPIGQTDEETGGLLPRSAAGLELLAQAVQQHMPAVRLRCSPWLSDVRPFLWTGYGAAVRYTAIVDVSDPTTTWSRFGAGLRARIRRAHREGMACTWSTEVDLLASSLQRTFEPWFDMDTAMRQVTAALEAGLARLYVVRSAGGRPHAAFLVTHAGTRAHYLLSGRLSDAMDGAVAYGIWTSMLDVRRRLGVTEYDLEGSLLQGVAEFYDQFGGRLSPYTELSYGDSPR